MCLFWQFFWDMSNIQLEIWHGCPRNSVSSGHNFGCWCIKDECIISSKRQSSAWNIMWPELCYRLIGWHSNCNANAWKHLGLMPIMLSWGWWKQGLMCYFLWVCKHWWQIIRIFHLLLDLFVQWTSDLFPLYSMISYARPFITIFVTLLGNQIFQCSI